jgi:putative DNA primase/helicase
METKESARHRWPSILLSLGVGSWLLTPKQKACPFCGGKDRFVFDDKHGHGDYFCRQCGPGDGFQFLMKFHSWDFLHAVSEVARVLGSATPPKATYYRRGLIKRQDVTQLWTEARQIKRNDPVDRYLRSRQISPDDLQIAVPHWAKGLRFTSRMWHAPTRRFVPCMLGMFRDTKGDIGTIHRTYLADVSPRRMFLPCSIPKGGAIHLGEVHTTMGVAEGIETALAASMLFKMSVWACATEGLLRAWQSPEGVKHIWIFGDNDKSLVGQSAAYDLGKRLVRNGCEVTVQIPHEPDWDWNDVLKIEGGPDLSQLRLPDRPAEHPSKSISDASA